ncbi:MAG: adenosylcobalamin-dependent ribonucleoside-diphosphate reductase [Chloroflexota bacterium]|nr:adenosylcobalamin-dependent ribonucleoside-diphosphate reductase [Chloroflexota bacterium]
MRNVEIELSDNSRRVLERRYLRHGPDGEPIESISEMFWRVAQYVAAADEEFPACSPVPARTCVGTGDWVLPAQAPVPRLCGQEGLGAGRTARAFFELLTNLRFLPNSPTFTGAGTPLAQLAACFVLPIEDDMGREPDGIFQTLRDAALIQQTGGGNGFSLSRLRPRGDIVHSSGGKATGPVGFLKVYDTASGVISQGGVRRGANMAVLRVDHPDIEEFIRCKSEEGSIANFNISVGITDAFMRAVEADEEFNMVNPRDGEVWETVQARRLFNLIAQGAHRNGEPGVLFLDTANQDNPLPHLGEYESTNPCGEQFLLPYENCCLGHINLARHVNAEGQVDWKELGKSVELATHFLDNVVSANNYVPAVPQLEEAALRSRRIGLGIMGLADMMYQLGIRYGSEEAQEFAAQVMEFIRFHSMRASIDLARQRGPFPAIKGSIYDPPVPACTRSGTGDQVQAEDWRWTPPEPLKPYTRLEKWGRPHLDWSEIVEGLKRYGIRNAAQTTIAPTGTTGTVAGCEGYGCEPVFALAYTRHFQDGDQDVSLPYVSPLFERALSEAGLDETSRQRIYDEVLRVGTCQHIEEIPEHVRHTFVVSKDITAEEHVRMQAALQAFVDSSISKTINLPQEASVQDVKEAFLLAWKLGCKGLTVYRAGSRQEVVLETEETQALAAESVTSPLKRERGEVLQGLTFKQKTPMGTAYVTVNSLSAQAGQSGRPSLKGERRSSLLEPLEVFINVGKAGSETAAVSEALGRLISLSLRLSSPLSARDRAKEIVDELYGIGGGRQIGFGPNRVRSLPDGIAQALMDYLKRTSSEEEDEALLPAHTGTTGVPRAQLPLPLADEGHYACTRSGTGEGGAPIGDLCPNCGQASLVEIEGCRTCVSCGYSEC